MIEETCEFCEWYPCKCGSAFLPRHPKPDGVLDATTAEAGGQEPDRTTEQFQATATAAEANHKHEPPAYPRHRLQW